MPRVRGAGSTRSSARPYRRSFVCSACALEGGGKTDFGATATPPIAYLSVDPNTRAVLEKIFKVKDVSEIDEALLRYHPLRMPAIAFSDQDGVQEEAKAAWNEFIELLRPIVKGESDIRSVVVDTATELDTLNVLEEFGKTDQITPESRRNRMGPVNRRWSGWIRAVSDAGVNVILLHRLKRKWESKEQRGQGGTREVRSEMTGPWDYDRIGHKDTGFDNSVEVFLRHDPDRSEKLVNQYGLRIMRSTLRPAIIGSELWGRAKQEDGARVRRVSFPYLATQIYPHTTLEDWQ